MTLDDYTYDNAEIWLKNAIKRSGEEKFLFDADLFDDEMSKASDNLDFPYESLVSFLRNVHLIHVKKKTYAIKSKITLLVDKYMKGTSILALARKVNYPSSMMARSILGELYLDNGTNVKKFVTDAMRDPIQKLRRETIPLQYISSEEVGQDVEHDIIDPFSGEHFLHSRSHGDNTRLAREVLEAINSDPLYGPRSDKVRNLIGLEFEMILEEKLRIMNISIETEGQLRVKGNSKTPDILLLNPVAIKIPKAFKSNQEEDIILNYDNSDDFDESYEWKMITWIDSKALFGDVETHRNLIPQARSYVHRYGPGLVLYWFGHAPLDRLIQIGCDGVYVEGWNVPHMRSILT